MPSPILSITGDPRDAAWRALIDDVQNHADVRALGILWRLPEDKDFEDGEPRDAITVRVVPQFGTMIPEALVGWGKRLWSAPVTLGLEITTPGDNVTNSAAIWSAIEVAVLGSDLQPHDRIIRDKRLADSGLVDIDELTPAVSPDDTMPALGSISLIIHVER